MSKDFKIWGVSYGIVGDLIMALPVLTYYEKEYPGSYKYWVIEKKCSQSIPLFINHPIIDRIKVTDEWSGFGDEDKRIHAVCDIKSPLCQSHENSHWYNDFNCIEETAKMAGVSNLNEVLSKEEMYPYLEKWFAPGIKSVINTGYTDKYDNSNNNLMFSNSVAIWPFAGYGSKENRSPSVEWWKNAVEKIVGLGIKVYHYGYVNEETLSNSSLYIKCVESTFFDQIKCSLESTVSVTTDSGSGWVLGAYSHNSIYLMTNWLPNHTRNWSALEPVNKNGISIFEKGGCDNIKTDHFIEILKNKMEKINV